MGHCVSGSTTHSTRAFDCHKVLHTLPKLNEATTAGLVKSIGLCAFVGWVTVKSVFISVSLSSQFRSSSLSFITPSPWLRLSLSRHSAGPPRVLPAGNIGIGGPQRPPARPHGPGCGADGDVSPDVQTDGDWVEPGDRTLQPAGQWRPRRYCQGEADGRWLVWDRVFVIDISLSSVFPFLLYVILKDFFGAGVNISICTVIILVSCIDAFFLVPDINYNSLSN